MMQRFQCQALSNLTGAALGREAWNRHSNDLWHWFKHASPLIRNGVSLTSPDVLGAKTVDDYLSLARSICRRVMAGEPGCAVKRREQVRGDLVATDYLVWFHPPGVLRGLFLVVNDRFDHGELETMFSPRDGRAYFDDQPGELLWGELRPGH